MTDFFIYLAISALTTYLIRALPLLLIKKKIENRFVLSLLHYLPAAILSVMTIPTLLYATNSLWSALAGLACGLVLAYCDQSLVKVALGASLAVLTAELLIRLLA